MSVLYDTLLYFSDNKCSNNLEYFKNNDVFVDIHLSMDECYNSVKDYIYLKKIISITSQYDIKDNINDNINIMKNKLKNEYKCKECNNDCIRIQLSNGLSKCLIGECDISQLYSEYNNNSSELCNDVLRTIDDSQRQQHLDIIILNCMNEINTFFNYFDKHTNIKINHENMSFFTHL